MASLTVTPDAIAPSDMPPAPENKSIPTIFSVAGKGVYYECGFVCQVLKSVSLALAKSLVARLATKGKPNRQIATVAESFLPMNL